MRSAILTRQPSTDQGTPGRLMSDSGKIWISLELPNRGNQPDISCILAGTFRALWLWSPKHQRFVYHLQNTPGRTVVEIHSFNLAGDISKGYVKQADGCIALGLERALFRSGTPPAGTLDQWGVTGSAAAVAQFEADMLENGSQMPFDLTIQEA